MACTTSTGNCGITFLSDNLVLNGDLSLTTGTENSQFPLSNLKNVSTARKFRSDGNSIVIEIDLQQTRAMDTFTIVGDATGQLGVTSVSFKTSVTTDFSGSPVNVITLNSEENMGYGFFTEVSHRYVEVTLTGTGSYAEIGSIFISKRIELTQNTVSIESFKYMHADKSKVKKNRYSQRFIDELPLVKSLSGSIEHCTKDEQNSLDDMFIRHGVHEPLWVFIDTDSNGMTDGTYKLSMYGYLTKTPNWTPSGGQLWNTAISLEQVV